MQRLSQIEKLILVKINTNRVHKFTRFVNFLNKISVWVFTFLRGGDMFTFYEEQKWYLPHYICFSLSLASISVVMVCKLYLGSQPHSSLAAVSSKESGQDSAIACLIGSTS